VDDVGYITLYGEFIENGIKFDRYLYGFLSWGEFFEFILHHCPDCFDSVDRMHVYH